MKNLIRGHIYQLKKDNIFFGCLVASFIFLIVTIRYSSLTFELMPAMGVDSMINTFLSGDIILYAFMLLTANVIAESYSSGVMKNIIGRGISKKEYYLSIVFVISAAYLLVMLIIGIVMGAIAYSKFGMGAILYPVYYVLSIIARILFVMAHISFAATMTIFTRNVITGVIFGLAIPNIPQVLEMVFGFLKIHISLDFLKISTNMPSVYTASNDLSSFLPCFIVVCVYLVLSIFAGSMILKNQDIK
jgi:ABC-type transport system involved in multi-copper enzyme maturation permease subunit